MSYMTFAYLTANMLESMGIPSARQLGQPREMGPGTGSRAHCGVVTHQISHFRIVPFDNSTPIHCAPLHPGTPISVTQDPVHPTWAYIQVPGGPTGWVGRQHVSSVPVPALSIPIPHTHVTARVHITHTYASPCVTSPQVGCFVPQDSGLIVIAMSHCRQWFKLDGSNTWIHAGRVQLLHTPPFLFL